MSDTPFTSPTGEGRAKLLLRLIAALAVVALCLSGYLTWTTWSASQVAGCGTDGLVDCDHVLASNWSQWLGLPVGLLGALAYVGILAACWPAARHAQGLARTALLALSLLAAGSAVWFIGLQMVVLQSYCVYCMAVHSCGLSIGVLTLLLLREATIGSKEGRMRTLLGVANAPSPSNSQSETATLDGMNPLVATGVASVGLALLMGGQFFFQPAGLVLEKIAEAPAPSDTATKVAEAGDAAPADDVALDSDEQAEPVELSFEGNADGPGRLALIVDEEEAKPTPTQSVSVRRATRRLISFSGLAEPIDVYDVPLLGNPEAEHVLVEMLDYTCKHCRHLHPHVHASLERYGDQVAFVVCHVPLSKRCNPHVQRDRPEHLYACDYARLALGVWKLDRKKFVQFHQWLMESKRAPSIFDARHQAMRLVGEQVLLDETLQADSYRSFASHSDAQKQMNTGLPILLTEFGIIRGIPKTEQEWFTFLEALLEIEPLNAQSQ